MTAVQLAEGYPIGGTVRNTDDGDVELILEGESASIDDFIRKLREHFGSYVRNITQSTSPAVGLRAHGVHVIY